MFWERRDQVLSDKYWARRELAGITSLSRVIASVLDQQVDSIQQLGLRGLGLRGLVRSRHAELVGRAPGSMPGVWPLSSSPTRLNSRFSSTPEMSRSRGSKPRSRLRTLNNVERFEGVCSESECGQGLR